MAASVVEDVAMTDAPQSRPGWHQDGHTPGVERWWNGNGWDAATRPMPPKKRSRIWWKIGGIAVVAFLLLGVWSAVSQTAAKEASTPPDPSTVRSDYQSISDRELGLLVKDPQAERGRRIALLASVFQLDSKTGESSMLVDAYADSTDSSPTRMVVDVVDATLLDPLVEGDSLVVFAEVWGAEDYETVEGVKRSDPWVVAGIIERE